MKPICWGLSALLFALLPMGCASVPSTYVAVLPPPVTSFPPAKPGLVRLPVDIVFPTGGDLLQHFSNLIKGGLRQLMPDMQDAPGLNIKAHVRDLWSRMETPIFLDQGLWLMIHPRTLSIGEARTDLKRVTTLHTFLEMTASPEIIFGPEPAFTLAPLPPLGKFHRGPGTFRATSNITVSYVEANQYFRDPRLKLKGMLIPGTGERKVTLEGIRLYGSGGQVVVEVKLDYHPPLISLGKPAHLTIYLKGTPRYHPETQIFDMPDLDYDVKSSDLMVQVADLLFKSQIRDQLRKIAVLPIGGKLAVIQGKINKALNRPLGEFARLQTQVNYFRVLGGYADNEGIEVRAAIQGSADLEVIWN
jgi:hypothetical protein